MLGFRGYSKAYLTAAASDTGVLPDVSSRRGVSGIIDAALSGDRRFESISLHRRVACEPGQRISSALFESVVFLMSTHMAGMIATGLEPAILPRGNNMRKEPGIRRFFPHEIPGGR
jgi:hypothetical protein